VENNFKKSRRCKMDLYDEIARVAYELWEQSGRIDGRDLEHWIEAERIVLARGEMQTMEETENIQKKPARISSRKQKKSEEKKSRKKI
jgi:hypothetical protein